MQCLVTWRRYSKSVIAYVLLKRAAKSVKRTMLLLLFGLDVLGRAFGGQCSIAGLPKELVQKCGQKQNTSSRVHITLPGPHQISSQKQISVSM